MKAVYILLPVLIAVVVGGFLYVQRPLDEVNLSVLVATPTPATTPVDGPISSVVRVVLKTSKGDITVALDGTRAPITVGNFMKLARADFYDGTSFHRVIPDFMIQGGDPFSRDQSQRDKHGTGSPGYTFADEINAESYGLHQLKVADAVPADQVQQLKPEVRDLTIKQFYEAQGYQYITSVQSLPMQRGIMAMANSGPNTNGSQFFIITAKATSHLAGKHTPFGVVESGMEIVDAISGVKVDERDNPIEPVIIQDIEVLPEALQTLP